MRKVKQVKLSNHTETAVFKLKDSELECVNAGKDISASTDRVTDNYKNRIAMTIDLIFTTTGAIIGGASGVSFNYSHSSDPQGRITTSWKLKSPSIGAGLVYASAGGLIGHKIANTICNKLIY